MTPTLEAIVAANSEFFTSKNQSLFCTQEYRLEGYFLTLTLALPGQTMEHRLAVDPVTLELRTVFVRPGGRPYVFVDRAGQACRQYLQDDGQPDGPLLSGAEYTTRRQREKAEYARFERAREEEGFLSDPDYRAFITLVR